LQHYLNFDSIPSMTDRQGILPVAVANPVTGALYPANTQIPISQINPFACQRAVRKPGTELVSRAEFRAIGFGRRQEFLHSRRNEASIPERILQRFKPH
jgi:hypothetical protein